jgi:hypothetical protein
MSGGRLYTGGSAANTCCKIPSSCASVDSYSSITPPKAQAYVIAGVPLRDERVVDAACEVHVLTWLDDHLRRGRDHDDGRDLGVLLRNPDGQGDVVGCLAERHGDSALERQHVDHVSVVVGCDNQYGNEAAVAH